MFFKIKNTLNVEKALSHPGCCTQACFTLSILAPKEGGPGGQPFIIIYNPLLIFTKYLSNKKVKNSSVLAKP